MASTWSRRRMKAPLTSRSLDTRSTFSSKPERSAAAMASATRASSFLVWRTMPMRCTSGAKRWTWAISASGGTCSETPVTIGPSSP